MRVSMHSEAMGLKGYCRCSLRLTKIRSLHHHQYFNVGRCESVRVSVTDVMSLPQRVLWERGYKVYYRVRWERVSYLLQWSTWSSLSRHSHSYRRATKAGQPHLEQAKTTIGESDFIARYEGKAEV